MSLKLLSCHFITFIGIEMLFHSAIVTNYLSVIRQRKRRKKKNRIAKLKWSIHWDSNPTIPVHESYRATTCATELRKILDVSILILITIIIMLHCTNFWKLIVGNKLVFSLRNPNEICLFSHIKVPP